MEVESSFQERGSVMNTQRISWLAAGLVVLGSAGCGQDPVDPSTSSGGTGGTAASSGAGGTSGSTGSGGAGATGGTGPVCPDDPADGPVAEECGVWVSESLGDDENPGTQSAPVASLTHAIELAKDGTRHVFTCGEEWFGPLVLPGTVSLHGGFNCKNGWFYSGTAQQARIGAESDQIPLTVTGSVEGVVALLTDFHVESRSAKIPGGSAIALYVSDYVHGEDFAPEVLRIRRCKIIAGYGADGLDGAPGDSQPAMAGFPGTPGRTHVAQN
jgi:hypothetical protein